MIETLPCVFTSITLSNISFKTGGGKSATINFKDEIFSLILREYGLDYKSYRILYELGNKLLMQLLNKKRIKLIVLHVGGVWRPLNVEGAFNVKFITTFLKNALKKEDKFGLQEVNEKEIVLKYGADSEYTLIHKAYEDNIICIRRNDLMVEVGRVPMERFIDDPDKFKSCILGNKSYHFKELDGIKPTIAEVLKFRYIFNETIEASICAALNIRNLSQIKSDHSSIIIQNVKLNEIVLTIKDSRIMINVCSYYLTGKYKSHRSNYNKTIII